MLDFKTDMADIPAHVQNFLRALQSDGFEGDILTGYADRLINATDNSIYQIIPQAVIAPKDGNALSKIMSLSAHENFHDIGLMPRGGGTGTNGQSLNDCIILDTSKYMTRILDLDVQKQTVRIEPGVVLDVLKETLKPHGLTFPVSISPSKSCTLGGMVATDACGKGSRKYGKTGDYVLDMTCILADGREISTRNHDNEELKNILAESHKEISGNAPNLPRGLSAYDLLRAYNPDNDTINMTRLITGSEGSLAVIKDITLQLIKQTSTRFVAAVFYDNFIEALRDVDRILSFTPSSIETIDDIILDLAQNDILWHDFQHIIPDTSILPSIRALHLVEFENEDDFEKFLKTYHENTSIIAYTSLNDEDSIQNAYNVRSKCVGLLGNMDGNKRPLPFIEDTAVPPQNLADYIDDVKQLLDSYGLRYGIFGHSDAGCLHIRPALNMQDEKDQAMIRTLSDAVVNLVQKHSGVIWGEHGKGLRGEYTKQLNGTAYANTMNAVKTLLDPHNKLNPGKIAAPDGNSLYKIDNVPMRGDFDRKISKQTQNQFPKAIQCNGNGQCFSALPDDTMCPSYKVTGDRKHSPKGRAAMLREWMRLKDADANAANTFSHEVFDALHGCLSCKACTSTCPIHVNIPDMKADFLYEYYKTNRRPLRDYMIGMAERYAKYSKYFSALPKYISSLVDMPQAKHHHLKKELKEQGFHFASDQTIQQAENPVLILQDAYTTHFETSLLLDTLSLLRKLGFEPLLIPFFESGKSWHIRGFQKKFKTIALNNIAQLENLARHDIPIIGIDPSLTLIYRDEYHKIFEREPRYHVALLQEWLSQNIDEAPQLKTIPKTSYDLFLHCTEKTMRPQSAEEWNTIFQKFGITLNAVQTGCCGMAGVYGHEKEHVQHSKDLFELSWNEKIDETALVTGYSCRSQIDRLKDYSVKHPLSLLNDLL